MTRLIGFVKNSVKNPGAAAALPIVPEDCFEGVNPEVVALLATVRDDCLEATFGGATAHLPKAQPGKTGARIEKLAIHVVVVG